MPPNNTNQYSYEVDANAIRRSNLLLYFQVLAECRPTIIIVGEAAGARGTRRTGIPLTDEATMLKGISGLKLFGEEHGFRRTGEFENAESGMTTTEVWKRIVAMRPLPLLWDAFPFHSHPPGKPLSNRKPNKDELAIGRPFLSRLLDLYPIETIVALGRKAEESLRLAGVSAVYVRHPAQGGTQQFHYGLREVIGR